MSKSSDWMSKLPKIWPGMTDDGYIGLEYSAFGGSSGIYVGPDFELSFESRDPTGTRVQWLHSDHDAELETIIGEQNTYTLRVRDTDFVRILEKDAEGNTQVISPGTELLTNFSYVTEEGYAIGWSAGLVPSQAELTDLVVSTGGDIQPGNDLDILFTRTILDDVSHALGGQAVETQVHVSTVNTKDGESYVIVHNSPVEGEGYSPYMPDFETLFFGDGVRVQRAVGGSAGGDNFLMRPAAVDEFERSGNENPSKGSGGRNRKSLDNDYQPVEGFISGLGTHPAGEAHTDQIPSDERGEPVATPDLDLESEANQSPYILPSEGAGGDTELPQPGETYTIQSGDTLSKIAAASGISVEDLAELNGITDPDHIVAGADLTIPSNEPSGHPGGAVAVDGESPVPEQAGEPASGDTVSSEAVNPHPPADEFPASMADSTPAKAIDPATARLGPAPTYSTGEQALAAGGAAAFGSILGQRLDLDGTGERVAFNVLNNAFQTNVSAAFDNNAFTEGFEDFGADLQTGFQHAGAGLIAAELSELLGFDGSSFGDRLGSAITDQVVTSGISSAFNSSIDFGSSLNTGFSTMNVTSLGAGIAANEMIGELGLGAETATGAVLSSVGSSIGATLGSAIPGIGTAIGSFIGSALGSAIGDMFSSDPPPPPEAEATLDVDEHGHYFVVSATDAYGGNAGSMSVAAQRAVDTINGLVDATGGRILDPDILDGFTLGYDGEGLYVDDQRFDSASDAIAHIVEQSLVDTPIEGGDVYVKRAVYRSLEDGFDPAGIQQALETAQAYSRYQTNATAIERLAEDEAVADAFAAYEAGELTRNDLGPDAALVLDARETAQAAEALGLDRSHRFDTASRLNDALEANGVDLEEIEITDLLLSNLHGELLVAVKDPDHPDAPIRHLPHASVDAFAADFDAAMLYLPDGGTWNLNELLDLADVEAGGGAVDVEQALIERYGEGADAIRMGSADDDAVVGDETGELLVGWLGADLLRGGGGDDTLIGGAGADTLAGGEGEDTADYASSGSGVGVDLETGTGHGGHAEGDRLIDIGHLQGSSHADHLAGDEQDNRIVGNAGDDTLVGRGGDDILHGDSGHDRLDGSAGNDDLAGHAGDDALAGGEGADRLSGGAGNDALSGGTGNDVLVSGSGDDVLAGGEGRDMVHGGSGDDTILATGDGDTLAGGEGTDTVAYERDLADYRVEWIDGELRIADPEHAGHGDRLIGIETVQFDDRTVSIETLKEYLSILDTADEDERQRRATGTAASTATAIGDAAAIGLVVGFSEATIAAEQRRAAYEAEGHQALDIPHDLDGYTPSEATPPVASAARLSALVSDGGDVDLSELLSRIRGGGDGPNGEATTASGADPDAAAPDLAIETAGFDEPAFVAAVDDPRDDDEPESTAADIEPVDAADAGSAAGSDGDEDAPWFLGGTPGDDELIDHYGHDRIYGYGGDDYIVALDGDDYIEAGNGDDRVLAGAGNDKVFGGRGDDVLIGDAGLDRLYGGSGNDTLVFDPHDEVIDGGTGEDVARIADGASITAGIHFTRIERIVGGDAADTIELTGNRTGVTVEGRGGDDTLIGGRGDERLIGGGGADAFIAGAGDDTIVVNAEDDLGLVDGGSGYDTVALDGSFTGPVDLTTLDTGTPGTDDGIEAVRGSAGADVLAGTFGLDRIDGGAGHDVVTLDAALTELVTRDPASGEIEGLEWRAGGEALHLTRGGESIIIEAEEIHFTDREIYLDGRDNAPITKGETFESREDERLPLTDAELTSNDFDIDPGDPVELLSVGGIDVALTRALDSGYWDETVAPAFIDPAPGSFRTADYGSYVTGSPKGGNQTTVNLGPRPDDLHDGTDGDDVLFGQVLTEYYGFKRVYESEAPSRTFHDSDRLHGHAGDDHFITGGGGDRVVGGVGNDTADYSRSGGYVEVDLLGREGYHGRAAGDTLLGIENVIGSDRNDTLRGDDGDNILQGGRGNDLLAGRGGNDILIGGDGHWDAAVFSGTRDEYTITAHDDHLRVEHLHGGNDGIDRLYGIQALRFADQNLFIGQARAEHGEIRLTDHGLRFDPDADFNRLEGTQAAFAYEVGQAGGARATETVYIDIAAINDAPYLAPGEADYDGQLRMQSYNTTPGAKGGESVWYWTVNATGQILGRDLEDAANLTYELVEQTEHGWVTVDEDGSFRYRLNVGRDGFSYETEQVQVCRPREGCRTETVYHLDPPADADISTHDARFDSFVVAITDHGEGDDDPLTVHKTVHIENDKPVDDDDCFPVALDLGDDGLDFRGIDDADLLVDINGDGSDDRMAWIGPDDGLLLLDRDGDGVFTHPDEISFVDDHPEARTDMEGLALAFDTNKDSVLDAADERWSEFHVWRDADGDGVSDAGELQTLDETGIASIGVISDGQRETAGGGDVTLFGTSTYTRTDGSTGTAADVALGVEPGEAPAPTNDELAAMLVQRMIQAQAIRSADSSSIEPSPPLEDGSLMTAMYEADEFDMANVAG